VLPPSQLKNRLTRQIWVGGASSKTHNRSVGGAVLQRRASVEYVVRDVVDDEDREARRGAPGCNSPLKKLCVGESSLSFNSSYSTEKFSLYSLASRADNVLKYTQWRETERIQMTEPLFVFHRSLHLYTSEGVYPKRCVPWGKLSHPLD
jgi:hypothetical protein